MFVAVYIGVLFNFVFLLVQTHRDDFEEQIAKTSVTVSFNGFAETGLILMLTVYVLTWATLFFKPSDWSAKQLMARMYHRTEAEAMRARLRKEGSLYNFCVETAMECFLASYEVYYDPEELGGATGKKKKIGESTGTEGDEHGRAKEGGGEQKNHRTSMLNQHLPSPSQPSPHGSRADSPHFRRMEKKGYRPYATGWTDEFDLHWEISFRESRNRIVVAIRGTSSLVNWQVNCQCLGRKDAEWLIDCDQQNILLQAEPMGVVLTYDKNNRITVGGQGTKAKKNDNNLAAAATETADNSSTFTRAYTSRSSSISMTSALLENTDSSMERSYSSKAASDPKKLLYQGRRRKSSVSMSGNTSRRPERQGFGMETAAKTLVKTAQLGADALLKPLIHRGFSEAYKSFRLNLRASILGVLDNCDTRNPVELYFTGHSLGGALATLACLDTQFFLDQTGKNATIKTKLYTFGAPRVGNHLFATLVNRTIRDSWRVVMDGDPIPGVPKCMVLGNLYKHAKHQALIDVRGNIIIDPLHVENLLHTKNKSYYARHNLDLYYASLVAADGMEEEEVVVEEEEEKAKEGKSDDVV